MTKKHNAGLNLKSLYTNECGRKQRGSRKKGDVEGLKNKNLKREEDEDKKVEASGQPI